MLTPPVGAVDVTVTGERPSELTLRRRGFRSEAHARRAGDLLRSWLQVASAVHLLSLDLGHDEAQGGLGLVMRNKAEADGLQIVPDVHGLVVVKEIGGRMVRFSGRATGTVIRDWERVVGALAEASAIRLPLSDKAATACALVSTAEHRTQHELQLVGFVTAAEILAEPRQRTGPSRDLLESLIGQAADARRRASAEHRESFDALCGGLQSLRSESLRSAVRRLAREARPADPGAASEDYGPGV